MKHIFKMFKSHHPLRHARSFKYAFQGIFHTLINEPNFRVQLAISAVIVSLGFHYRISAVEWCLLILVSGLLLAAEMINTVVEEFMDNLIREYHNGAKVIKDVAAGFVLIIAVTAALIALIIFVPKIGFYGV